MNSYTYRDAGVDIDAGAALVKEIAPLAAATQRPGVVDGIGGFAGLFDLKAAGFRDPLLLATTDGVGTKLKLAIEARRFDGIGIDLVAMCVNDLVVQGAEPLLFLDYYATGRLDVAAGRTIVAGIAEGCRQAGCALLGGETAEMPGLYAEGDFDLAGFAVGAVERDHLLTGRSAVPGDVLLGLASSGVHSNGYSLVRRLLQAGGEELSAAAPFDRTVALSDALLVPTRIYVRACLAAARAGLVRSFAHITGGGIVENLPRVLPDGLTAQVDGGAWPVPPVFRWLARLGVAEAEMLRTFNCGIGMIAVVPAAHATATAELLRAEGETVFPIGRLVEARDGPRVTVSGLSL